MFARAPEKETTLTHFRGVDVATLARQLCHLRKFAADAGVVRARPGGITDPLVIYSGSVILFYLTALAPESGDRDPPKVCEGCLLCERS